MATTQIYWPTSLHCFVANQSTTKFICCLHILNPNNMNILMNYFKDLTIYWPNLIFWKWFYCLKFNADSIVCMLSIYRMRLQTQRDFILPNSVFWWTFHFLWKYPLFSACAVLELRRHKIQNVMHVFHKMTILFPYKIDEFSFLRVNSYEDSTFLS